MKLDARRRYRRAEWSSERLVERKLGGAAHTVKVEVGMPAQRLLFMEMKRTAGRGSQRPDSRMWGEEGLQSEEQI